MGTCLALAWPWCVDRFPVQPAHHPRPWHRPWHRPDRPCPWILWIRQGMDHEAEWIMRDLCHVCHVCQVCQVCHVCLCELCDRHLCMCCWFWNLRVAGLKFQPELTTRNRSHEAWNGPTMSLTMSLTMSHLGAGDSHPFRILRRMGRLLEDALEDTCQAKSIWSWNRWKRWNRWSEMLSRYFQGTFVQQKMAFRRPFNSFHLSIDKRGVRRWHRRWPPDFERGDREAEAEATAGPMPSLGQLWQNDTKMTRKWHLWHLANDVRRPRWTRPLRAVSKTVTLCRFAMTCKWGRWLIKDDERWWKM